MTRRRARMPTLLHDLFQKVYTLSQNCDAECNQEQVLETLASWNLAPWEVPGDGDCLFTSSVIHILDKMKVYTLSQNCDAKCNQEQVLETLASWNLALWEVPGDGDCLFTSSVIHILDEMKVYTLNQNCDAECNQEQVLETLASWNLAPWEVPGDGDCLFTSSVIHI